MVGIVVVSHSNTLAEGVLELARQMTQDPPPMAAAGGIDDPTHPIGTDPLRVLDAINQVYSPNGVLVLMDLGSALMSAETALELVLPERQQHIRLCAAPLVEGTLAAVVQASVGGSLQAVYNEAMGALAAKMVQLGETAVSQPNEAADFSQAKTLRLIVPNRLGLHARPAARFVSTANQFAAEIRVSKGGKTANAKSINQVATLGARQGDEIVITASGEAAAAALAAIEALAYANFGDIDESKLDTGPLPELVSAVANGTPPGALRGIPASPGIAIGMLRQYRPRLPEVKIRAVQDVNVEWTRLETAVAAAAREIQSLYKQAVSRVGAQEADIFEAHLLIVQDPDMRERAHTLLTARRMNAEAAWWQTVTAAAQQYREMEDPYMQARAADVLDVGQRVLGQMMELERPSLDFSEPVVLVATDLAPSDTARMNPSRVLGICTEMGGATSHTAILARALGIPAVVGIGNALADLTDGQMLALDGTAGFVWLDPDYETLAELKAQQQVWLAEQLHAKQVGRQLAITPDGRRIEVAANIGGPHDTAIALEYGAEGVGLFRTEFLFLERDNAPSEEEQTAVYTQVAKAMNGRPLIIRTLDIGGDKPLPYLATDPEDNPFLGWRGIRLCLGYPDLFKPQLRAILRASVLPNGERTNVKIMFPMIGALSEVQAAKAMLAEAQAELRQAGMPFDAEIEVGIMIEVPSAVAIADRLAAEVDFFSIGTNDLTQYVMAADRGNAKVANLANALQPAVLRLVQQTVQAAHAADIWVGMCGELAGNALAAPLLVGLGLDELSMSAPSIPAVKQAIRRFTLAQAQELATQALALDSAEAVQAFLQQE